MSKQRRANAARVIPIPAPRVETALLTITKRSHTPVLAVVYATTIFLGAFLLFQVQLILGKFVLPRFGGGASVWSASLLTFQLLLLAGYGYAAFLTHRFAPRQQSQIHLGLLLLSAIAVVTSTLVWHSPILPFGLSVPSAFGPALQIVVLLIAAVGFPCVLLSASSPLLQKWMSEGGRSASPYRLYALSNLGSLLGLLIYPFVIERFLHLTVQASVWTALYCLFLALTAVSAWSKRGTPVPEVATVVPRKSRKKAVASLSSSPRALWLALSACGSMMLLATTNLISQEVAPVPLLWVVPLCLYLLSFIICFDHPRWYWRGPFQILYLALAFLSLRTLPDVAATNVRFPLLIFCATLFAVCMVCHGELARLKPEPSHLTGFYLAISMGGALGSAFVVLLAPKIFNRIWEFQIALLACGLLVSIAVVRDRDSWLRNIRFGSFILASGALVLVVSSYVYLGKLLHREGVGDFIIYRSRNFFGTKTVANLPSGLFLFNGRTMHGGQNPAARNEPLAYYHRESGIGLLLNRYEQSDPENPLRIGVIGMGVATLAAYARTGDFIRFYELDPEVASLSQGPNPIFTFVKDSPAHVEIAIGDARIRLQQELAGSLPQNFDVLVVDAFSSDAVPVHLLTREALAVYLKHLRGSKSMIAFHVTNRSIDLRPVVAGLAREYHLASLEVLGPQAADWILLCADGSVLADPILSSKGHAINLVRPAVLWTDDYSSLYPLLLSSQ